MGIFYFDRLNRANENTHMNQKHDNDKSKLALKTNLAMKLLPGLSNKINTSKNASIRNKILQDHEPKKIQGILAVVSYVSRFIKQ